MQALTSPYLACERAFTAGPHERSYPDSGQVASTRLE